MILFEAVRKGLVGASEMRRNAILTFMKALKDIEGDIIKDDAERGLRLFSQFGDGVLREMKARILQKTRSIEDSPEFRISVEAPWNPEMLALRQHEDAFKKCADLMTWSEACEMENHARYMAGEKHFVPEEPKSEEEMKAHEEFQHGGGFFEAVD